MWTAKEWLTDTIHALWFPSMKSRVITSTPTFQVIDKMEFQRLLSKQTNSIFSVFTRTRRQSRHKRIKNTLKNLKRVLHWFIVHSPSVQKKWRTKGLFRPEVLHHSSPMGKRETLLVFSFIWMSGLKSWDSEWSIIQNVNSHPCDSLDHVKTTLAVYLSACLICRISCRIFALSLFDSILLKSNEHCFSRFGPDKRGCSHPTQIKWMLLSPVCDMGGNTNRISLWASMLGV